MLKKDFYKDRIGDWMQLLDGRRFYPLDFRVEDVDVEDIAYGLARESRFNGKYKREIPFYSVAHHSIIGSRLIQKEFAFDFLMHDASEAYLKDLPKPVKNLLPEYSKLENKIQKIILQKFNLSLIKIPEIKEVDDRMLYTEKRDIMQKEIWKADIKPFDFKITEFWTPQEAYIKFMERFNELNPSW